MKKIFLVCSILAFFPLLATKVFADTEITLFECVPADGSRSSDKVQVVLDDWGANSVQINETTVAIQSTTDKLKDKWLYPLAQKIGVPYFVKFDLPKIAYAPAKLSIGQNIYQCKRKVSLD
jgi:hypothetical protein